MQYYIYISDTKIEMLYSQISRFLFPLMSAEIRGQFSILNLELKAERSISSRSMKLAKILRFLSRSLEIGSVYEPRSFFEGTLDMHWGDYSDLKAARRLDDELPRDLVFFTGQATNSIVALAGSWHHVVGKKERDDQEREGGSDLPSILATLAELADERPLQHRGKEMTENPEQRALRAVEAAALEASNSLPSQRVEFLAKTLLQGCTSGTGRQVILGSPLYVALHMEAKCPS